MSRACSIWLWVCKMHRKFQEQDKKRKKCDFLRTISARERMALAAFCASSWLSLISTLIICTGRFSSCRRLNRSDTCVSFFHCQTDQDCVRTLANAVEAALFTCDNNIWDAATLLPALRGWFNVPITIQHRQEPIGFVESRILLHQVLEHGLIRCTKRIDIGLVNRRAW